jgi:hypothetical protein
LIINMQGKQFIYFLFDENNNSYYQYGDTVLLSASLKPLEFTPDGWKKIQIQNQRNGTYFAIDRSFTLPLDYVKDGAQILKHIYYNYGVEAKVFMSICEQRLYFDATHYGFYYTLLYKGEIDLAQLKHDGTKVTVNIMEGGMVKFVKAYENTKYEIPVDVPDAVDILMDGVDLQASSNYTIQTGSVGGLHVPGWLYINSEGTSLNIQTETAYLRAGAINTSNSDEWIIKNIGGTAITFTLEGFIKVRASANGVFIFGFETSDGVQVAAYSHLSFPGGVDTTIPFNVTITLQPGERLFSIASWSNTLFLLTYLDGDLKASFISRYKNTTIKALRPAYVFQQLINKITGGTFTAQSDYLTNEISDVVVTCGDAIRGITGAKIKTSLRDFFTSFNSHFGLGMGMMGSTLRLEPKSFWVQYTDFIDLGEVSKMKVYPASDLLINNIKVGTPNQEYDDVNGKEEFNTTHEYSAPITRVAKDLNLVSVYRADCYGIEFTRLNLDGKTTTDNDSDNDVFMIQIEDSQQGDGTWKLDRFLNAGATGLLSPATVFNLYLTPARALRRNGSYIRSLFYKLEHKYLTFQTTDKNDQVVAGGITENDDVQIVSLDPALFSANYLEFETKVPVDTLELLKANPLKAFAGTWAGFSFVGIPDKVSVQPGDNGAQTFKLLASPQTDLTTLISIDG